MPTRMLKQSRVSWSWKFPSEEVTLSWNSRMEPCKDTKKSDLSSFIGEKRKVEEFFANSFLSSRKDFISSNQCQV